MWVDIHRRAKKVIVCSIHSSLSRCSRKAFLYPQDELLAGKMVDSSLGLGGLLYWGKRSGFFWGGRGLTLSVKKHTLYIYVCVATAYDNIDRVELHVCGKELDLDGYQSDLPSRTKLPQWDIRTNSVSSVSVPESRAQVRITIFS